MQFHSLTYAVFYLVVVVLYWTVARRPLLVQNVLVLGASYLFYGWWDWRFLFLILGSSLVDYFVAMGLSRDDASEGRRKALLATSLVVNLGALGFFKYFNFFIESASMALEGLGLPLQLGTLNIILPVGISFYTFQTISYTVEVYRGQIKPTRDPIAFLAFVSFFPQLVAGPIERAEDLLPQFLSPRRFDLDRARDGLRQALWGMAKKVVIADTLAMWVDPAFATFDTLGGVSIFIATWLFMVQLYCDFSGYSDIAIGCARVMGFDLSRNFAYPFFSRSLTEFWQRWHITLYSWLRDYLFFEIEMGIRRRHIERRKRLPKTERGPRRPPRWTTAANLVLLFTVSGLWHGATWAFVIWGVVNGLYLVPEFYRNQKVPREVVAHDRWLPNLVEARQMLKVNVLLLFSMVLFRSQTVDQAFAIYGRMLGAPLVDFELAAWALPCAIAALPLLLEWPQRHRQHALELEGAPTYVRWGIDYTLVFLIVLFAREDGVQFVYFQF